MLARALILAAIAVAAEAPPRSSEPAPGLRVLRTAPGATPALTLIEADPAHWRPKLLCAAHAESPNLSARAWAKAHGLGVAVNGGMFQQDHRTSVGLLVADGRPSNRRLGKDKAVLAFGPLEKGLPQVQIVDRECQDFSGLRPKYSSLLQGIRMINCRREVVWAKGGGRWPIAAAGTTSNGRLVIAFSPSVVSPSDFASAVLALEPDLDRLMYLEGGPPAQFYLKAGSTELEATGASGEASESNGTAPLRLPIPNVLGLVPSR